ncbi:MAG: DUF748 domain-containing protein [Candidatus Omnitrophota bacterium]
MKKAGIALLILLFAAIGVIYHYRFDIFQFSAETMIMKMLPDYIDIDRVIFDLKNGKLMVKGFSVKNPSGYEKKYLATIETVTCRYKMRGKNILDGLEVTEIEGDLPVINIERKRDGKMNVNEMGGLMATPAPAVTKKAVTREKTPYDTRPSGKMTISDIIKLPDTIHIVNGKVFFEDRAVMRAPYLLSFENVNGDITLKLSAEYTRVLSVSSVGNGFVNNKPGQRINWVISLDPLTSALTMSNRFEVSTVDITLFKPYYDRYSPIDIQSGLFSGTLVFDFDNGNIGSTNTVEITGLRFTEKQGGDAALFWDVSLTDVIKYLESSPGRIIFDFKIKGDMRHPNFYPGPRVKEAIQGMVVDKVSNLFSGGKDSGSGTEMTDAEKVVDVLKGFLRK